MNAVINSAESLQRLIGNLRTEWQQHKYLRVKIDVGTHRSLSANAQVYLWYAQVARERGDMTPEEVRCYCKLRIGVPILRADDEDFRVRYDALIRDRFSYEEKLQLMAWFPVTSLMRTPQHSVYREEMQRHWAEQGIVLEYLDEAKAA